MSDFDKVSSLTQSFSVLFVDDDASFLEETSEVFSMFFKNVTLANNGLDAFKKYQEHRFDIVITDINMPTMDGIELIKKIKQIDHEQIIIVISAHNDSNKLFSIIEHGISSFLIKPIQQEQLLNTFLKISKQIQAKQIYKQHLIQQTKLADMGSIIDIIAHQWLSPLNLIKMRTSLLKDSVSDTSDDMLDYINDYTFKQTQTINHLIETLHEFRDFFKPQKTIQNESLEKLVYSVLKLLQDELKQYNVGLNLELDPSIFVYLYPNEFKHVLINLILNAIEAFNEKNIENRLIKIYTKSIDNKISLSIEDNAGGIEKNIINTIFNKNFTTKEKGNGIGLYISQKIIEKINGQINVSSFKQSTTFTITFDINKVHTLVNLLFSTN